MKASSSFVCQECGYESAQWMGKCPECGQWNTLREFKLSSSKSQASGKFQNSRFQDLEPKKLSEIKYQEKYRILSGFSEVDNVLGGGIVSGSVILLAGDPGIGKSTLLLEIAFNIALKKDVLYVSGEESEGQVKLRAQRISKSKKDNSLFILSQNNIDQVVSVIEVKKPSLVIIDSIQTMESENLEGLSGSVGQVRYTALELIKIAKRLNIPVIVVGHVTKEGMVAGPMILTHMVDTVLFLEGEKTTGTRILRSFKNRFGPVDEVGIFSMQEEGMAEVKSPEELFLSKKSNLLSGSVLTATLEGTRAFLVEIQALTVFSKLPMPRRVASGVDYKRLELLLAVLNKHCRLPLDTMDVFVNVAGGLKLTDPACDLGICLAIYSSYKNMPLNKTVGVAEIGLLGELRKTSFLEKRIKQAKKLGYKQILSFETHKSLNDVLKSLG